MSNSQNNDVNSNVFQAALGLSSPWFIQKTEFSQKEGLDIHISYPKGSRFICPLCDQTHSAHDYQERVWRHLNFFQFKTYLHAPLPRLQCPKNNNTTITVSVPWARPNSGFTLLFEAFAMELASHMPLTMVEKILGIYDNRIMRIVQHYVQQARSKVDMSNVKGINADETSKAKGHDYITVFSDQEEKKVLYITEGRDAKTFESFAADLVAHKGNPAKITTACIDLSKAFIKGVADYLPNASIVFDKFHVMGYVNNAVDEVCRQERKTNPLLNGSRYAFLHSPENATATQKEQLESLCKLNLKTVKAYNLKLALKDIYSLTSPNYAESKLKNWYFWATHCRLQPMIDAAKTIKRHWQGVVRYFKDRVTNAFAEAINGIIQTIKRQARGFKNTDNFITLIFLRLGKLRFDLPPVIGLNPR